MRSIPTLILPAAVSACLAASSASAIDIVFDFTYDTYFQSNPTALATLEQAAADLEAILPATLDPVVSQVVGNSTIDGSTATSDFSFNLNRPDTGQNVVQGSLNAASDEFVVFVGIRELTNNTLGLGGPTGININSNASFFSPAGLTSAVNDLEADAALNLDRGDGPVVGTLLGDLGGNPITFQSGPFGGVIVFDSRQDNNGTPVPGTLDPTYWHLDGSSPVAPGLNDLYSVALHELIHTLGIGTTESWDDLVSGEDWLGSEVAALVGSGIDLVDDDAVHIAEGFEGFAFETGTIQEVVMDPNILVGTRKYLTDVDVAFLADIGWTVVIPEPNTLLLVALGGAALLTRRRQHD